MIYKGFAAPGFRSLALHFLRTVYGRSANLTVYMNHGGGPFAWICVSFCAKEPGSLGSIVGIMSVCLDVCCKGGFNSIRVLWACACVSVFWIRVAGGGFNSIMVLWAGVCVRVCVWVYVCVCFGPFGRQA